MTFLEELNQAVTTAWSDYMEDKSEWPEDAAWAAGYVQGLIQARKMYQRHTKDLSLEGI